MSRDGSVAPKERINIRYVPATGDASDDVELPLSMMAVSYTHLTLPTIYSV